MSDFPNYNKKTINKIRKQLKLSKIKTGIIKCLNCGKKFNSFNIKLNKICPKCSHNTERKNTYYNPYPIYSDNINE